MFRLLICIVLFSTLFLTGCGIVSTSVPAKNQLPTLEGEWTIRMVHSGGIMGLSRSIEISSNRTYTVTDERADKTITGKLSADKLENLREIVVNSEFQPMERLQPSGCADCFMYNLEIQGGGSKFMVQVDDITMPDSGMERLIMYLRDLLEAALNNV